LEEGASAFDSIIILAVCLIITLAAEHPGAFIIPGLWFIIPSAARAWIMACIYAGFVFLLYSVIF
jgi:hypothetical protein